MNTDMTPRWPDVDENDLKALAAERARLLAALASVEEAMREKHGSKVRTV